jgi:hypothetical protein
VRHTVPVDLWRRLVANFSLELQLMACAVYQDRRFTGHPGFPAVPPVGPPTSYGPSSLRRRRASALCKCRTRLTWIPAFFIPLKPPTEMGVLRRSLDQPEEAAVIRMRWHC